MPDTATLSKNPRVRPKNGDASRVAWLDGLRGVASLQVLALHFLTAFFPALGQTRPELARHAWEHWFIRSPLFYLADGFASVNVFFLISGTALTFAFQNHPFAVPANVARRIVRLGLPMAASMILGFALFALLPDARIAAGHLIGDGAWLHLSGPPTLTLGAVSWEMTTALFLGHIDLPTTLLPHNLAASFGLIPVARSFNGPVWTLHLEFAGSVLVLALVALRAKASRTAYQTVVALLLVLFILHPLGLFVLGHALTPLMANRPNPRGSALGIMLFAAGLGCAAYAIPDAVLAPFVRWNAIVGFPAAFNGFQMQSALEALLVFAAAILCQPLRTVLTCWPAQLAGRLSFSLYLVHFPILLTISCLILTWTGGSSGASLIAILAGCAASSVAAIAFERLIDRPAIGLSHRIRLTARREATQ